MLQFIWTILGLFSVGMFAKRLFVDLDEAFTLRQEVHTLFSITWWLVLAVTAVILSSIL